MNPPIMGRIELQPAPACVHVAACIGDDLNTGDGTSFSNAPLKPPRRSGHNENGEAVTAKAILRQHIEALEGEARKADRDADFSETKAAEYRRAAADLSLQAHRLNGSLHALDSIDPLAE